MGRLAALRGLIPARAGNTGALRAPGIPSWAHPRSRGEHAKLRSHQLHQGGSSPLARGTLAAYPATTAAPGLIPARAGNTGWCLAVAACLRAHPRSRGEHQRLGLRSTLVAGSSPLARGTPWNLTRLTFGCGLIPARAGNTSSLSWAFSLPRAHPRSRGEHRLEHWK